VPGDDLQVIIGCWRRPKIDPLTAIVPIQI
jgi:hypothetical protein